MSEYTEQAEKFLKETGTKFTVKFLKHDYHFENDKDARDIYKCVFRRNGKSRAFTFGQSVAEVGKEPCAYGVLSCLTKSDPGDFECFCGDFGYDMDSRSAEKTWKAVCAEFEKVEALWSDVIDQLQEIF
jgi:hypothetical protein